MSFSRHFPNLLNNQRFSLTVNCNGEDLKLFLNKSPFDFNPIKTIPILHISSNVRNFITLCRGIVISFKVLPRSIATLGTRHSPHVGKVLIIRN